MDMDNSVVIAEGRRYKGLKDNVKKYSKLLKNRIKYYYILVKNI